MAGLKINICFWYLDENLVDEIVALLEEGNYDPVYFKYKEVGELERRLEKGNLDLIISDFDLPDMLRDSIESVHSRVAFHVPLIYLVGEKNEQKAAETLKRGVWDYLQKNHLVKLVPTVYSSQKYGKVLKQSRKVQNQLEASEAKYRSIFNTVQDGMLLIEPDSFRILDFNRSLPLMFGIPDGWDRKEVIDLVSGADTSFCADRLKEVSEALDKQNSVTFHCRNQRQNGEVFYTENTLSKFTLGPSSQYIMVIRDVTEAKKASAAIKKSEERLNLAVEATNLGYWDWSLEDDKVYYSPIYFNMLGYAPGELPQELNTWKVLLHEDEREKTIQFVEHFIKSGKNTFDIEFRLRCKDGSYKWISSGGQVVDRDEQGNVKRLIGTHKDISESRRNEAIQGTLFNISNAVNTTVNLEQLYEKIREHLGKIVDTTNCFLALYNEETNMLTMPFHRDEKDSYTAFPAGKTLTGYVLSTGKAQLIDAEREKQLMDQGLIEPVGSPCISWLGVPLRTDHRIIGVFVVQSYSEEVIYTPEDVRILEFVSDQIALAVERKRDQDNVRESQEKQRRIFESSPDPILVVDTNGIVTDYNTSLLAALHVTNEPVIGQNIFHFIGRNHWRAALRNFKQTWEEGYLKNLEFEVQRADGTSFESEVSTGAIYDNEGEPDSMVVIIKDISERKEAERSLREAKDRAEESDRLKTAFLSNMSHEIRTPMNAIVGFSDLLNDQTLGPDERSEFIAQINMGAENLMHLIDDIIDISKIEAGQIKINKQECDINELLKEQLVMFRQYIDRMDKSHLELRLNWKWPDRKLTILTDPFRVKQILSNLMNNAVKFTEEGYIEVGIGQSEEKTVRIWVKDTGIGVSENKQAIIFDRFRQGHRSRTKLYGGTGLGLAISKNLAELLGGEMGVISGDHAGSEFWFTLPANLVRRKNTPKDYLGAGINTQWEGKKILVAEDDSSNFSLIAEVLKHTNIQIIHARDGKEALDLYEEHKADLDLVLMDIRMPEINGYDCARVIKEKDPDIPIIAQTAYAMSGERDQSMEAGCDDYISKPLQVKFLIETIGRYLK